jgi:hypothetical protein
MARPRKIATDELQTAHVGFQITPAKRTELKARAAANGRHLSDYCRIVLLSDPNAPAPSARDWKIIRALLAELARNGNNLNQLAHIANECHDMPSAKALAEVIERLIAVMEKVRAL